MKYEELNPGVRYGTPRWSCSVLVGSQRHQSLHGAGQQSEPTLLEAGSQMVGMPILSQWQTSGWATTGDESSTKDLTSSTKWHEWREKGCIESIPGHECGSWRWAKSRSRQPTITQRFRFLWLGNDYSKDSFEIGSHEHAYGQSELYVQEQEATVRIANERGAIICKCLGQEGSDMGHIDRRNFVSEQPCRLLSTVYSNDSAWQRKSCELTLRKNGTEAYPGNKERVLYPVGIRAREWQPHDVGGC